MEASKICICALAALMACSSAQAVNIETVPVGDSGNTADTRYESPGYGAVGYAYDIGRYEVTAGQYCEFLNNVAATDIYGLYNTSMWSDYRGCRIQRSGSSGSYTYSVEEDWANRPVNFVSFWDSCRFANWLHNGQPTGAQEAGTTERGAYTLDGFVGSLPMKSVLRNASAQWAVAGESEWYKAAYYKGGSTNAGYWDYPTCSDTAPGQDLADLSGNNANWYAYPIDQGKYTTVVGQFENSASPYGTFDQGGNVWEWTDTQYSPISPARFIRGGSWSSVSNTNLLASFRAGFTVTSEYSNIGFRVVYVPEPATLLLVLGGLIAGRRARR